MFIINWGNAKYHIKKKKTWSNVVITYDHKTTQKQETRYSLF